MLNLQKKKNEREIVKIFILLQKKNRWNGVRPDSE